ncbi:MAG TPA: ABC transporter permease [Actinocatenispora sp.]
MNAAAWRLLRAEWTKAHTVSSTGWLVAAIAGTTLALGGAAAAATHCSSGSCDPIRTSLTGVQLGQVAVVLLAVLAVGTEYSTGTIQATLAAAPRHGRVLAAKVTLLCALVLPVGAASVAGSLLVGRAVSPGHGFRLLTASALRAAGGSVLYLVLIALLTLGVTFAVRNSAAAIGTVLALLYLTPIVAGVVTDTRWQRHLLQLAPMSAGLSVQATVGIHDLPIGPWPGLGVLAGWTAAALLAGATILWRRDT